MIKKYARALRLPFIITSLLAFVAGSLLWAPLKRMTFFLGILGVAAVHLGANLINDYADSRSGVDWQDKKFYGLFGGSKLIQQGIFSERFYLCLSLGFFLIALLCFLSISLVIDSCLPMAGYLIILVLGVSYSWAPFRFSYRGLGEVIIFILFGPALVMGGYFIQSGVFPDTRSFLVSMPFGFFTTAILLANEVPDYPEDSSAGKNTWVVSLSPEKAWWIYGLLAALGLTMVIASVFLGYLGKISLLSLALSALFLKAVNIIRYYPRDKEKLLESSKLTIIANTLAGVFLILGVL
ncbi:MAG: prenyltransferase [Candidatus Omnitrophica bacterium]|nr:prenyltransferase [Candidatus Omnitrophota bacterium]MDD5430507.1 prenyltransferase [Candidatus Omnitrophota bacterium]